MAAAYDPPNCKYSIENTNSMSSDTASSSADDPTLLWKEVGESLLLSKKGMSYVLILY